MARKSAIELMREEVARKMKPVYDAFGMTPPKKHDSSYAATPSQPARQELTDEELLRIFQRNPPEQGEGQETFIANLRRVIAADRLTRQPAREDERPAQAPSLTDDEFDRLQEEFDCCGIDARLRDFADACFAAGRASAPAQPAQAVTRDKDST